MYRRDGQISLYLFQTRNKEVEEGLRLFTVFLEAAPLSRHVTVNPEEKGIVWRFRVVRSLREGRVEGEEGFLGSSLSPSSSSSSSFTHLSSSLPIPSSTSSSSTMALATSRLRHLGPTAATPHLTILPPANARPLARFPLGLDASTFAAKDEASFAAHVLANRPAAIIFPLLEHTVQIAVAPPPFPSPAGKVEPVSLASEEQQEQQEEFAHRARKAEVRRRRRRMLKEQQQKQKEREEQLKQKKSEKGAARKQGPRGEGEEGGAEVGSRAPPPPLSVSHFSSLSGFLLDQTALLPLSPLPPPFPSPPPLAPRGGLAARPGASLWSHQSPITWSGYVPVLHEIPGALAVFEEDEEEGEEEEEVVDV